MLNCEFETLMPSLFPGRDCLVGLFWGLVEVREFVARMMAAMETLHATGGCPFVRVALSRSPARGWFCSLTRRQIDNVE